MKATFVIILLSIVLFAGVSVDTRQHAALHSRHPQLLPLNIAATRIAQYAEANLPQCFRSLSGEEADLTRAIVAVEYVSVSRVENVLEFFVAEFSQITGFPLLNLSYGAAQMKPSTLYKVTAILDKPDPRPCDFVDDCKNIAYAHMVIKTLFEKYQDVTPQKAKVHKIIRAYTGQLKSRPEHIVHNAIVMWLYGFYNQRHQQTNDN